MPKSTIREFRESDAPALHAVFLSSIHGMASRDYTPAQIQAWASAALEPGVWMARMRGIQPFVLEQSGQIVAYADLQTSGYIDHFFVAAYIARTGVGTLLMQHLLETARTRGTAMLSADVSRTAQPFFVQFGFVIQEHRTPLVRGVAIPNALMRRDMLLP